MEVVEKHDLFFIEDCAHAYCTTWGGRPLGTFGHIGCFSTQSSKGMSAGEGGIFVTNDDEYAAKAALYAGSYEKLWKKHYGLDPEMMDRLQNEIPGYSMRMHEVTAAMLLPQIPRLAVIHEIHVRNHACCAPSSATTPTSRSRRLTRRRGTSTTRCSSTWWA